MSVMNCNLPSIAGLTVPLSRDVIDHRIADVILGVVYDLVQWPQADPVVVEVAGTSSQVIHCGHFVIRGRIIKVHF